MPRLRHTTRHSRFSLLAAGFLQIALAGKDLEDNGVVLTGVCRVIRVQRLSS